MRVGIIAAAGASPSPDPRLGERDALLVQSRLELEDLGFTVFLVDPNFDLAEQIDDHLRDLTEPIEDLVLYASCLLAVVDEGECFLCLNPEQPDVGDALREVAQTVSGQARRGTLLVLELRYDDAEADRVLLTQVLANVQDCVDSAETGAELIGSVRPLNAHIERIPSRLTAGLLEAIDDKAGELTARQAYATAIQKTDFGSWPNALCYTAGARPLEFIHSDVAAPISEEPITEEPPTARPPQLAELELSPQTEPSAEDELATASAEPSAEPPSEPTPTDANAAADRPAGASPTAVSYTDEEPEEDEEAEEPEPPTTRFDSNAPRPDIPSATSPDAVPVEDLTPTTPRLPVEADVSIRERRDVMAGPPSERRIAATTSLPTHQKPSAPASLPKVILGSKAKSKPPPASEPPPARPLFSTQADGPKAKRMADAVAEIAKSNHPERGAAPNTRRQGSGFPPTPIRDEDTGDEDIEDISIEEEIPELAPKAPPPAPVKKRPMEMTVEDHVSAGDLARGAGRDDEALAQFKKALAKLGTQTVPLRAQVYVRIGHIARKTGKTRVAISNYDKALNITAGDLQAISALIELNAETGNWRAVAAAEDKFFASISEDDESHVAHLLGSGDLWREGAEDPKRAKKRYDAARKLAPKSIAPLEKLLLLHEAEGALEHVLDLRRRIAMLTEDPRERAGIYFALGEYCFEVNRDDDAYASLELALDADPTLLKALEVLSNGLAQDQEWGELERVYEKMIGTFKGREMNEANITVLGELHHRLALLHRDHLEDPERALASLAHELELRPDQLSTRIMAADLAIEIDDKGAALEHLRVAAKIEPRRAETYHQIFGIAQRHDDTESAFLAASVAGMLGATDDRERIVHREHRVEGVPALHHPLDDGAWGALKGADRDESVDSIMLAIAPAVLRTRVKQLEAEKKLPSYPDEARQDLDASTISAVRSLGWACQFLSVPAPVVFIDEEAKSPMFAPFAKVQTTVVGKGALRGRTLSELAFIAGQHVALRLPEHELVAHLRNTDELTICFLAALKIVLGTTPARGDQAKAVEALANTYASQQTPEERDALIEAVDEFSAAGGRVNLRSWIASVEHCAARAGLLLCGDLETAARLITDEGDGRLVSATDLIDDLAAFAISAEHIMLRDALGVALL